MFRRLVMMGSERVGYFNRNDVILINSMCWIGIAICVILMPTTLIGDDLGYAYMNSFTIITFFSILFFNYKKYYTIGKVVFSLVLTVQMTLYSIFFGNTGSEIYLIACGIIGAYFLRDIALYSHLNYVVCGSLFLISKIVIIEKHGQITFDNIGQYIYFPNLIFGLFIIYIGTRLFRSTYERQRVSLEKSKEARGNLLSTIAHDMRGPIRNLGLVLDQSLKGNFDEKTSREIQLKLATEIRNVSGMLDNTLEWSKSQMEGLKPEKIRVVVDDIIMETLTIYNHQITEKGIDVKVLGKKGITVNTDLGMFKSIFRNLFTNALKFSPRDKGEIRVDVTEEHDKIWIAIIDNGQGMSAEVKERLRESFESTKGTSQEKGYGLGLKLVFKYIDVLDEELIIESTLNKGSSFRFCLEK